MRLPLDEKDERKKEEDDEIGATCFLTSAYSQVRSECFWELLGSIILSACLVWGVVASLAIFLLVHQYGILLGHP